MGIAAYNRGTAAIQRQFDAELKARTDGRPPINRHYYLGEDIKPLRDRIGTLELELDNARRALASSRAMLAVERDNRAEERGLLDARVKEHRDAFLRRDESWRKASAMIRALLTPEQVEQYRQDRDWQAGQ